MFFPSDFFSASFFTQLHLESCMKQLVRLLEIFLLQTSHLLCINHLLPVLSHIKPGLYSEPAQQAGDTKNIASSTEPLKIFINLFIGQVCNHLIDCYV